MMKTKWVIKALAALMFMAFAACGGGSSKVTESNLVGVWISTCEKGYRLEVLNNGTAIDENVKYAWRLRSGNLFEFFTEESVDTARFKIKLSEGGQLLTLTNIESGEIESLRRLIFVEITEQKLLGVWELEDVAGVSRRDVVNRMEFFNDGTAIMSQSGRGQEVTWRLRDGNRLQSTAAFGQTQIQDVELSENGTLLTFHYDGRFGNSRAIFRKK